MDMYYYNEPKIPKQYIYVLLQWNKKCKTKTEK